MRSTARKTGLHAGYMIVSKSAHPRYAWRVKWHEGTARRNRFFATEKEARRFAARKSAEIRDIAPSEIPPTPEERRALAEARAHKVPLMDAIAHYRRTVGAHGGRTMADLIAARIDQASKDAISEKYRRKIAVILALASDHMGATRAVAVSPPDCQSFVGRWSDHASQTQAKAILSGVFTNAMRHGWIATNPAAAVRLKRQPVASPVSVLTVDDAAEWLSCVAAFAPACLAGWSLAMFAGLRRAEVERIDWAEVRLDRRHIEVTAAKSKTRTRRLVDIMPNLAVILEPLAGSGRVLPHSPKRAEEWARKAFGRRLPKNVARHSFVSYHLALFGDLAATEIQAGHDRAVLFRHYRELVTRDDAEAFFTITV